MPKLATEHQNKLNQQQVIKLHNEFLSALSMILCIMGRV